MTTTLSIPEVLRIAADNLEAGRKMWDRLRWHSDHIDAGIPNRVSGIQEFISLLHAPDVTYWTLAPKTITYTVKDQPEPLRVAPAEGSDFWGLTGSGVLHEKWVNNVTWQREALARGNIFATREDAEAADRARMDAFKGAV